MPHRGETNHMSQITSYFSIAKALHKITSKNTGSSFEKRKNRKTREGNVPNQLLPHYHNSAVQLKSAETLDLLQLVPEYIFFPSITILKEKKKSNLITTKDIKTGLDLFPHYTKSVVHVQGHTHGCFSPLWP